MVEGVLALFLFSLLLLEWPKLINKAEAKTHPDSLAAKIRMDRFKAGKPPWP